MHWWWDHGWGMGWMMWFWPIALLFFVVLGWYLMTRGGMRGEDSPELLLKRRYAKGEMDKEEYECRLRDLRR